MQFFIFMNICTIEKATLLVCTWQNGNWWFICKQQILSQIKNGITVNARSWTFEFLCPIRFLIVLTTSLVCLCGNMEVWENNMNYIFVLTMKYSQHATRKHYSPSPSSNLKKGTQSKSTIGECFIQVPDSRNCYLHDSFSFRKSMLPTRFLSIHIKFNF